MTEPHELYTKIWQDHPDYRKWSPAVDGGELERFLDRCEPKPGSVVLDVGCGVGRSAPWLREQGYIPVLVDFCADAPDPGIADKYTFHERSVLDLYPLLSHWVFSTDLLEHLAPEDVPQAFDQLIASSLEGCYLVACRGPDSMGPKLVGEPLHLTVRSNDWWFIQARDACRRNGATMMEPWVDGRSVAFHIIPKTGERSLFAEIKYGLEEL